MKNIILKVISELRWEKLLVIAVPLLHLDDKRKIEKTERKQRERDVIGVSVRDQKHSSFCFP